MKRRILISAVVAFCVAFSNAAWAQEAPGSLSGYEIDEWGMLALYAAREDLTGRRLTPPTDSQITTDYEAYVMGALALGKSVNGETALIARLQRNTGKFADYTDGTGEDLLNAHIWGMIALECAGGDYDREAAQNWLLARQNEDGGFPIYGGVKQSDGDMTAMAVAALDLMGLKGAEAPMEKALAFIESNNGNRETAEGLAWEIAARKQAGAPVEADLWSRLADYRLDNGTYLHLKTMSAGNYMATWHGVWAEGEKENRLTVFDRLKARNSLSDIGPETQGYDAVMELVDKGVLSGYPDGTFRPEAPVKRGEFVKMLAFAMEKENEGAPGAGFSDMRNHWARPYADLAASYKIFNGISPDRFDPESGITGAQLAAVAVRVRGLEGEAAAKAGDAWYSGYVLTAWQNGLLYKNFEIEKSATRAQCAELIGLLF